MNNEQQRKYDERRLETLEEDYNHIKGLADALRNDIYDLTLEERVPDARERQLMTGKRYALESLQENIRETIVFLRKRVQANKPEPWEEDEQHHCGQDAKEEAHVSLNELLGMEVICVGGSAMKCEGCSWDCGNCVKVELVGGTYMCLAKPQEEESITGLDDSPKSFEEAYRDSMNLLREFCIKQSEANQRLVEALKEESEELKKPVINFDEENNDSLCSTMQEIKEKVDDFMNYLDSVVINPQEQ